ncbi:hypothetical protein EGK14_16055 [Erwinia sp. 198]|nr:hypothetical protein EGK14_16055 [Erwinia sp. 198]
MLATGKVSARYLVIDHPRVRRHKPVITQPVPENRRAWPDAVTVDKYLAGRFPSAPADLLSLQQALYQYGYDKIAFTGVPDEETQMTISAFQMHFRPADISGKADAETEAIA